ncbi:CPBP family intramembrane glutamic endopeptidase [Propionispora hippei]|uniref:CAAX protease self-immunity n=1 Tax=Propionispora hippei DSM 15287 TaxID=1123003 RepID=A0A1M6INU5_9FIRM|nr:CPBP family intramembrane glutamic endopeptidase [Propionispora hippei]SHJ36019.1 CAAX protease self-immunity [Propionispora hippei DSM 15287]
MTNELERKREWKGLIFFVFFVYGIWTVYSLAMIFLFLDQKSFVWILHNYGVSQIVFTGLPIFYYLKFIEKVDINYLKFNNINKRGLIVLVTFIAIEFAIHLIRINREQMVNYGSFIFLNQWTKGIIISSLMDEILYRGVILQKLMKLMPFWIANIVVTLVEIALYRPGNAIVWLDNFIGGIMFGYVFKKSNSLWGAILAHAAFNFINIYIH